MHEKRLGLTGSDAVITGSIEFIRQGGRKVGSVGSCSEMIWLLEGRRLLW